MVHFDSMIPYNRQFAEDIHSLACAWAEGAGSRRYFFQTDKFSVCCVLCHIAPVCHVFVVFCVIDFPMIPP